ncbi:single-stranded DNA-binding protein [Leifsonia shinshuensis]|uniref:Single-stranded DNA-binding protein n=1 Tax=Leifsonia shinshuensis TaxID=150026 RepID=A0A7G6Y7G0_9MICO|nr:single-stranded DNA-binding protein [Leifsonia shinshuensis]QNE34425.1 single-stranded DNA-binding protein [Leifsonia shinshuensis]
MTETVAVRGTVATSPRHIVPEAGAPITSFRLVTNDRRRERRSGATVPDAPSNWFTVTAFDELAVSAAACIARGDPLLVSGRLCVRDWEGEQLGVTVEIEAEAIGHDLTWGRSEFTRSTAGIRLPAAGGAVSDAPGERPDPAAGQGDPTGAGP